MSNTYKTLSNVVMTNERIQFEIAKFSIENLHEIYEKFYFDEDDDEDDVAKEKLMIKESVSSPANWTDLEGLGDGEYDEFEIKNGLIERIFDCDPLDDQLRAYVSLKDDMSEVVEIIIEGE